MTAIGARTLELAGRLADGVVLHTFLTDETLARSVATVRRAAAEAAGRDPHSVRVWAVLATVEESVPEEVRAAQDASVGSRRTSRATAQVLVDANGWDRADLERFRDDPLVAGLPGSLRRVGTPERARPTCATT